jgi:predicted Abi (CAAX) family protease
MVWLSCRNLWRRRACHSPAPLRVLGVAGAALVLLAAPPPLRAFDGSGLYQPHATWLGRLLLPAAGAWPGPTPLPRDWVWIEIQQAPAEHRSLIGQRLPLTWQADPRIERLVALVTTDVRFTPEARQAMAGGWVLPQRLEGRGPVGPLASLAGARPQDDLQVSLEQVQVDPAAPGGSVLRIARPPIQIRGQYKALLEVLAPDTAAGPDRFWVRHFNRASGRFDGRRDSVRIPASPLDASGLRRPFSPDGLVGSAAGREGWYAFGEADAQGVFTVRALQPRALVTLAADRRVVGPTAGFTTIHERQWQDLQRRQGQLSRTWIQPAAGVSLATPSPWRLGDEALVLHLFGGMGGPNGELQALDDLFATGHFSFGVARVVTDSLSGGPILEIRYHQLYAHNREGIVSGSQDWSAFMGDLQRGWMRLRPVSDLLVRLDRLNLPVAAASAADPAPSPLQELALQSEVMMARYRTGDGTGFTNIGLFQSCVQDSAQALYITLAQLRQAARRADGQPADPGGLNVLADGVSALVAPAGQVRPDWAHNAAVIAASAAPDAGAGSRTAIQALAGAPAESQAAPLTPFRRGELRDALLSRRTILPRQAQQDLARLLMQQGADLWLLRTTQIPAPPPGVVPLAPGLMEP